VIFLKPIESFIGEQVQLTGLYSKWINEAEEKILFEPVTLDEIKEILTKFQKDKSPGPDGWTMEFFHNFL
jgi:hypothetical protein